MSRSAVNVEDSEALVNAAGEPTATVVREVEPSREYQVPVRLTGQPANTPIYRPQEGTEAEKQPFLPSSQGQPKERLTLVRGDNDKMAQNGDLYEGSGWRAKLGKSTRVSNSHVRDFLAEFLGSFILIIFGNGAVAEVVLSKRPGQPPINDFFSINVAYGLAVAFGVYVAGGVSGGHLNPAVTLGFAIMGKLSWVKVPIYMIAQILGCFVASAVIHAIYFDAFNAFDGGVRVVHDHVNATGGIFASYPQPYLSWSNGLVDQIFATSFLMLGILALTDERNMGPHKGVVPILVGLLVTAIGLSYGYNCGYPINPARDFGPRLYTLIAGWGVETFSYRGHNWFWIPIVGPLLGGLMGVAIYQLFIGNQWPPLQRTGIELQVVRKAREPEEYELVKAAHVRPDETAVPVSFTTKETQRFR